ncbi:hypothetical protein [Bacteroides sp.]|uniref:hypothetical protein n=1 Tax=Bacteroides sp. TaxID=29523 RepID=UPI003AB002DC
MDIKKENVLAAYETARKAGADSTMKVLEQLFGEETFKPKDITERIKTFEDACRELGNGHPFVCAYRAWENGGLNGQEDIDAYLKLRIICAALNEGWEPQFTEDERRYYPWFWLYTQAEIDSMDEEERQDRRMMSTGDYQTDYAGFAFAISINAPSTAHADIGSRLCLKSDTLAVYCGKQFIDLWADFYLIRK